MRAREIVDRNLKCTILFTSIYIIYLRMRVCIALFYFKHIQYARIIIQLLI